MRRIGGQEYRQCPLNVGEKAPPVDRAGRDSPVTSARLSATKELAALQSGDYQLYHVLVGPWHMGRGDDKAVFSWAMASVFATSRA
jgi:hypothetical protein